MTDVSKLYSTEHNIKNIIVYIINHNIEKRLKMINFTQIEKLDEITKKLFLLCERIIDERYSRSLKNCKESLYDIENYKIDMGHF